MSGEDKIDKLLKEEEKGIFGVRMGNLYVKELIKDYFNVNHSLGYYLPSRRVLLFTGM